MRDIVTDNQVASNLVQITVPFVGILICILKRRCMDVRTRRSFEWRCDVARIIVVTMYSLGLIVLRASLDSSPCAMFNAYMASDLVVGIPMEMALVRASRASGMRVGFYGMPPSTQFVISHLICALIFATASRCVTIAVVGMMAVDGVGDYCNVNVTAIAIPYLYMAIRAVAMDDVFHLKQEVDIAGTFTIEDEFYDEDVNSSSADATAGSAE